MLFDQGGALLGRELPRCGGRVGHLEILVVEVDGLHRAPGSAATETTDSSNRQIRVAVRMGRSPASSSVHSSTE
jgi:hypothetical protein